MRSLPKFIAEDIPKCVARALTEDIGSGDISAQLIDANQLATGRVISREKAVICGRPWVDEVFFQLDPAIVIDWHISEGDWVKENQTLFSISGNARVLLSGERCALNFLQTLSGTATTARQYANLTTQSKIRILDTRKTIPGLRLAQKYAVDIGGCSNHRIGLYDAFLIKENHIIACGGIANAVNKAKQMSPDKEIEVEVECLDELKQAVSAGADRVMLDNFTREQIMQIKAIDLGNTKIEVSGNVTEHSLSQYLDTPIDYISSGSLTKNIQAIDLSMRLSL
ncbi:MAG: carboxylating nicotinate-nucleotide diphosphorylase [Porticoccaceae bacterium]|nr:nicotinate-nucleotide diphosphorylase (carboxylating) [Porticoccaceae bacterium]RPG82560.1 MAG: carboxylating nicotinate-nucleotide diphosphorylase [Cellvibrionales bacterium TMED47]CAI8303254.1 MAG: Nicotinate-nucleotide pyrophosphorylase [carboxylating] [Cellvibrionales bacterium UBA7375]|tara:strand:+ start:1241 stop:2086 length:846 start_codon:yes stop_codon:yes gene_type:complete